MNFVQKYIPTRKIGGEYENLGLDYDYFCIGSDQVWNPEWYDDLKKEIYLLTFSRPEQKVCMAPSFGVEHLVAEWQEWFGKQLKSFPYLAVREKSGAKIIEDSLERKQWL